MKKLVILLITLFFIHFGSIAQTTNPSENETMSIDFDKAVPAYFSKLHSGYANKLKKAEKDYVFKRDKSAGYDEAYLTELNNRKVEVYVFKDKNTLVNFIKKQMRNNKSFLPGSWGSQLGNNVCNCAGGIQCSCPSDDGYGPIEHYYVK